MNQTLSHALPRALLPVALVCAGGMALAQSNAPAAAAVPPPAVSDAAGQSLLERSMAQGRGAVPPAATASGAAESGLLDRKTQKIEHLHFEDAGNRVDEIRSGGQTQRITVQPKNGAPAYEVQPANPITGTPGAGIGQTGPRVWRIHQF